VGVAVLIAGVAMCNVGAGRSLAAGLSGWATGIGGVLGLAALLSAVVTVVAASGAALAVQVCLTVALWLFATVRHAMAGRSGPPRAEVLLELHKDSLPPRVDVR